MLTQITAWPPLPFQQTSSCQVQLSWNRIFLQKESSSKPKAQDPVLISTTQFQACPSHSLSIPASSLPSFPITLHAIRCSETMK